MATHTSNFLSYIFLVLKSTSGGMLSLVQGVVPMSGWHLVMLEGEITVIIHDDGLNIIIKGQLRGFAGNSHHLP